MPRRVLIIVGHPDPSPSRFCRALAAAYAEGAEEQGHQVSLIDIATLDFPWLRSEKDFQHAAVPAGLADAVRAIADAEHIVFVFPLWLGSMPALLKAFLEQAMRPGTAFVYAAQGEGLLVKPLLNGRSARMVVTMNTPSLVYRFWFGNHGVAGMRRNILNFVGLRPVRETLIGSIGALSEAKRKAWLERMRQLGSEDR